MSQFSHRNKPERVVAEPRAKLPASIVRLRRDLKDCVAHPYSTARRQVAGREIEFQKEAISKQGERLAVCNQFGHVLLHDGNLHVVLWLRGTAPRVARNPSLRRQDDPIQGLSPTPFASSQQQSDVTVVFTCAWQSHERLFQDRQGSEPIRLSNRIRINCYHAHRHLLARFRIGLADECHCAHRASTN